MDHQSDSITEEIREPEASARPAHSAAAPAHAAAEPTRRKKGKHKKKKGATAIRIAVIAAVLCLAVAAAIAGVRAFLFASELRAGANALKNDAKTVASALKKQDADSADAALDALEKHTGDFRGMLASPMWRFVSRVPGLRDETASVERLADIAGGAADSLLRPYVALMREYPLSALKVEDGINAAMLLRYLDFAQEHMQDVYGFYDALGTIDLGMLDSRGRIGAYLDTFGELLNSYKRAEPYLPLARTFLGNGEDRLYVFAAQNSSEIRASGGFPGSVGTVRIRDGVLRLGDFVPVNTILAFHGSGEAQITYIENVLFAGWLNEPRDADYCPDFERVAEIWAIAYKDKNGEPVDGVLSATPVIIQQVLGAVGEIELSDGTLLNGENATKAIEYDLYYKYFSAGSNYAVANEASDALFAETAEKTMELLTSNLGLGNAGAFLDILEQGAENRTLMLWFKDEQEQELVRELKLDCGLNRDPAKPEAGIYFSLNNPGRMGWFLDMDAESELVETHEDGSKTYAITLTMANVITQEELDMASSYISGVNIRGCVGGFLHLFAPAGGTISDVDSSNSRIVFERSNYHELDLQYYLYLQLYKDDTVTFRYTVTTAPGEQEELRLSMTPTLQEYRRAG